MPAGMSRPIAQLLPFAEVVIGVTLLLDRLKPWSALSASGLFLAFSFAVAINILRGRRNIACGCFGSELEDHLSWGIVFRNVVLGSLAGTVAFSSFGIVLPWVPSADGSLRLSTQETVGTVLVAGAVLLLILLWRVVLGLRRLPELERCGGCS